MRFRAQPIDTTEAARKAQDIADDQITWFMAHTGPDLSGFDVLNYEPAFWPHLYLLDVTASDRLLVRLVGQHIRDMLGRQCRGHFMDEFLHGPKSRDVMATFAACVRDRCAAYMTQSIVLPNRPVFRVVAGAMPLFDDGRVARLAGLMHIIASGARSVITDASRFEATMVPCTPDRAQATVE